MNKAELEAIAAGEHAAPHQSLGLQKHGKKEWVVTTFQPQAASVEVNFRSEDLSHPMEKVHPDGLFQVVLKEKPASKVYDYEITGADNAHIWVVDDPYRFPLQIEDTDLYLLGEGTHYRTYEKMGAHLREIDGVSGVFFAVWAPNAARVSVIGPFNHWDGRCHPMSRRDDSGLWELFIPGLVESEIYKFEIKGPDGYLGEKSDPYGFAAELRPKTASVVWDIHKHEWQDDAWMKRRRETNWMEQPVSIYEMHIGSWKRKNGHEYLTYRDLADELIPYVKDLGFTHIELMPISEHPYDGSWGYQTAGYFAITSRFGTPDDFQFFVDRCHQEGIGVIVDWVPAHFPKDAHGLAFFDGTHLYEHSDPRLGEHMDWGTLIFNYGRNEVKSFLLSNAMFLADVYHIDGLRVDAVASMLYLDYSRNEGEWLPNEFGGNHNLAAVEFLKQFNIQLHGQYPGIMTFAEESTSWSKVSRPVYEDGLGFGFKWNMGWMNDTLEYFKFDPVHRKYHHNELTFSMIYAFNENFLLPFSHDEVVHGKGSLLRKMPGSDWEKFANLRLLYAYMWTHPGKKLLFMGCEFAQWDEWDHDSSLDWHLCEYDRHKQMLALMRDLNRVYAEQPSLHTIDFNWEGFQWIDSQDGENSVLSYLRRGTDGSFLVVVLNLTPIDRHNFRLGVPEEGGYQILLNTDSEFYGGSNQGSDGVVEADPLAWHGMEHSIKVILPPLSVVVFKRV